MAKVIFTGAQGTGKTTILNEFQKRGYNVITEVVRNLSKEGVNINEMGDTEGQTKIFETYEELLKQKNYISDRGLTDVLAYTAYMTYHNPTEEHEQLFVEQYKKWLDFLRDNPDVIICYFPIEFDVVDDGVRSTDEDFRKEVDGYIDMFLHPTVRSMNLRVNYHIITGTVEERIKQVEKAMGITK